jgi:DNA-binding transcriptional MerR regulator/quercetin dioxygenase-like cupin family protein
MLGVSTAMIRAWENEGLITPRRSKGGYRTFSQADVRRLMKIRDLRAEGINASGVRKMLAKEGETIRPASSRDKDGVGTRLRALRAEAGLSLRDVASLTGLSPSYISSVERSLSSPSIASLQKMAAALGTNIPGLFGETDSDASGIVVRATERKVLQAREDGVTMHRLGVNETMLEPLLFTIDPGAGSAEPYEHDGEEFIYVSQGVFAITLDLSDAYVLHAGDSITFRSRRPHTWSNPGEELTILVWVNTPPTF